MRVCGYVACVRACVRVLRARGVCACARGVCVWGGLSSPERKAHAPYYTVIRGVPGPDHIFPHYLINSTIFGIKNLLNIRSVFLFPPQLLSENVLIPRIQLDTITKVHRSSCKVSVILVRV